MDHCHIISLLLLLNTSSPLVNQKFLQLGASLTKINSTFFFSTQRLEPKKVIYIYIYIYIET